MKANTTTLYRKINEDYAVRARLSAIADREELASEVVRLGRGFSLPVTPKLVAHSLTTD